jgi:hypothetical protein
MAHVGGVGTKTQFNFVGPVAVLHLEEEQLRLVMFVVYGREGDEVDVFAARALERALERHRSLLGHSRNLFETVVQEIVVLVRSSVATLDRHAASVAVAIKNGELTSRPGINGKMPSPI